MPRVDPIQASVNGGEFSRRMLARSDFGKYRTASRRFENLIALAQGGGGRRPGSRFVREVKDSSAATKLMPFKFSTTQAYQIERGNNYFRFYRNQGVITVADTGASITNGAFTSNITNWSDNSGASSSIAHDSTNGRLSLISNGTTTAIAEQEVTNSAAVEHVIQFQVLGLAGDEISFQVGTTTGASDILSSVKKSVGYHTVAFTATAANFFIQFSCTKAKTVQIDNVVLLDNAPLEIVTPWATADLPNMRWAQDADTLYITSPDYPVYKLQRSGHTTWSISEVEFEDGPYLEVNTTDTTLDPAATTGLGVTFTASAVEGVNEGQGFLSTDVGRLIRIEYSSAWGYAVITAVASTTSITCDIKRDFGAHTAEATWQLGAWSGTTGYPETVVFHEQRLVFGNTDTDPDKVWLSQTGGFEDMRPDSDKTGGGVEVQDDDAFNYRISADDVTAVLWLKSGKALLVGTASGEWNLVSSGSKLTPTDAEAKQQTKFGSAPVEPIQTDNAVLFVTRGFRQLREYAFNFEADGFRAPDLTILAEHILKTKAVETAYAQTPDSLGLIVRTDGRIGALSYKREQDIVGWSRWVMGGAFSSGIAVVESVSVIPGNNGDGQVYDSTERDEIWVIVKRTIDGATVRYVEFFEAAYEGPDPNDYDTQTEYETALLADQVNAFYVDSGLTYNGSATDTITGLDHLEGQTVKILADGAVHPDKTVASGSITLDYTASVVHAGLGFFHDLEPMKLDYGNPAGSAIGKDKTLNQVTFVLHETGALRVGDTRSDLVTQAIREVSDSVNSAIPLFSGEHSAEIEGDWITDPRFVVRDDAPTAFTMLAFIVDMELSTEPAIAP